MKIIMLLFLPLFIGCKSTTHESRTTLVQLCLDKMHQNKAYDYLESAKLFLVKNEYSVTLNKLHLGNKVLLLTNIPSKGIKHYTSASDIINNERHLKVSQLDVNGPTAEITIRLMNVNQLITFYLSKNNGQWQVNNIKVSVA